MSGVHSQAIMALTPSLVVPVREIVGPGIGGLGRKPPPSAMHCGYLRGDALLSAVPGSNVSPTPTARHAARTRRDVWRSLCGSLASQ